MKIVSRLFIATMVSTMCLSFAARSQTSEVHIDGNVTFDLPGARAVTGLSDVDEVPPAFLFGDSGERKLQPGFGFGFSTTFFKDRLGLYEDLWHVFGDSRRATVTSTDTSPAASVMQTNSRSFSLIQAGLQFHFSPSRVAVPYFQIGIGFLRFTESGTDIAVNTLNPGTFPNPAKNTQENPFLHCGVGVRVALKSLPHGQIFGIRFGVDGYYLKDPIFQYFPGVMSQGGDFAFVANPRHGFGRATFGFFYQFRSPQKAKKPRRRPGSEVKYEASSE